MTSSPEWLPRPVAVGAIAAAAVALVIHAVVGFQSVYLNHTSGVWLALARDLTQGLFIRDLVSDAGYGGTRYFPLFFSTIAAFARLGLPILTAGWIAGVLSAALLVTGTFRAIRALRVPPMTAAVFAAGTVACYFTQQTVFEIRADVLSAALNMWGLALALPVLGGAEIRQPTTAAAACFVLAFATKVTSLLIPGAIVLAAMLTRNRRVAVMLAVKVAFGLAAFMVLAQMASRGRAMAVWSEFLFAGTDGSSTLRVFLAGGFLPRIQYSHLVVALFAIVVAVSGLAIGRKDREERATVTWILSLVAWLAASASVGLTLSSPGTVATNQLPEWIACSMLVLAASGGLMPRRRGLLAAVTVVLVLWMSAQDVARAREQQRWIAPLAAETRRVVERLRSAPAPVLAESPLWPVLAEQRAVILDAFATRVILRAHPEIERRLVDEITSHRYGTIVLAFDPASPEGRRMYQFAHFGAPVISAIVREYRLEAELGSDALVFVPRY